MAPKKFFIFSFIIFLFLVVLNLAGGTVGSLIFSEKFMALGKLTLVEKAKAQSSALLGNKKILAVLIYYEDSGLNLPITPAEAQTLITDQLSIYEAESYGKMSWVVDVAGWYLLPRDGPSPCNSISLLPSADEIANLVVNDVNLSDYENVIGLTYHDCDPGVASIYKQTATVGSDTYSFAIAWIGYYNTFSSRVLRHEVGHTLGLYHANGWMCDDGYIVNHSSCRSVEYRNYFSIMGYGGGNAHFNAAFKDLFGWFNNSQLLNINRSGIYTLNPLERGSGVLAAKIKTPQMAPQEAYYLEYRRDAVHSYYYAKTIDNADGLFINLLTKIGSISMTNLLDASPNDPSGPNFGPQVPGTWFRPVLLADTSKSVDKISDEQRGVVIGPVISNDDNSITFEVKLLFPSELRAVAVGSSQVNLSWFDNHDDETRFEVERSTDGTNFTSITANLGENVTNYSDINASPGSTYYYRVRACNDTDCSLYSNVASAATDPECFLENSMLRIPKLGLQKIKFLSDGVNRLTLVPSYVTIDDIVFQTPVIISSNHEINIIKENVTTKLKKC